MPETNKKSLSYKIQKNPFLLVFIIIVLAVLIFGFVNITSAIQEKSKQKEETTTEITTEAQDLTEVQATETNTKELSDVKKYSSGIESITITKNQKSVSLKVEYKDKDSLLKIHEAKNINSSQVVPVFCFYLKDGTQIECPGELNLVENGSVAEYHLSVIDDFANAVALTDEVTVTYDNVLDNQFNLYLRNKTGGNGKTIFGTYKKPVEEVSNNTSDSTKVFNTVNGIDTVKFTKTDEFVWVDIYYTDVTSYTELNNDFINNFVCFGFESGGASFKRDFIVTEYDSLNMLRCKFDSYSLSGLADEMGVDDITVNDLFTDYVISVWTSDYDKETSLFTING